MKIIVSNGPVHFHGFPSRARFTAEMSPLWLGAMMEDEKKAMLWEAAVGFGPAAVGMGAMCVAHFLAGNPALTGLALVAGGGLSLLGLHAKRISSLNAEGGGAKMALTMDKVVKNLEETEKLGQLALEATLFLGNLPRGTYGGGSYGDTDELRRRLVKRLSELGIGKRESAKFGQVEDPIIARRIIISLISNRLAEAAKSHAGDKLTEAVARLRELLPSHGDFIDGKAPPCPADLETALGVEAMKVEAVRDGFNFYRDWFNSDARLYFTVENIDQLK